MKKTWLWIVILAFGLCLFPKALPAEDLSAGRAAVFMQDGGMIVGEVVDISSTRLVLQLRDGQEFALHRIWMINFVNTDWNFPEERTRLEKDQHYLFFRNDRTTYGRIIDFSSTRRVFQFDTKEEVPIGEVRRIYFTNQLPSAYQSRLAEAETQQQPGFVGTYSAEVALASGVLRTVTLTLNEDRTALLTQVYPQGQLTAAAEQGSWTENADGTITVRTNRPGQVRRARRVPFVFRLENNELVAVQFDQRVWGSGGLRLKRN